MKDIIVNRSASIDELEVAMLENFEQVNCPLTHRHTQGLYVREIFIPKGTLLTSKIHNSEHQYFVLKGKVIVWIDGDENIIKAPYIGITKPNTQRVILALKNTIWATAHPNPDNETEEQIEDKIINKHDNLLLTPELKNKLLTLNKKL